MIARGTRLGPYEIDVRLGAGGMGEVYQGRDTRLDRRVAIKILSPHLAANPEFKLRFEREARAISALNHPHICVLHDIGEATVATDAPIGAGTASSSVSYLVMELCEGETLADRLARGPLPLEQVLRYGIEIADALDRAHRNGITHRDLKPGNIMLTRGGAKLLDFGLAKGSNAATAAADEATAYRPITQEGTIVGTFQYMAPEQIEGRGADPRSDIFALGAVLYEMVTGKRAFDRKSRASVIAAVLERVPRPIAEAQPLAPASMDRVVRTCLAKDPDERWQSAHDLRKELEWMRDGLSTSAAPAPRKASRAVWAAAVILPLVAVAATWLVLRSAAPPPQRLIAAIASPPETQFLVTGDAAGPVTLSPDGSRAVFVATSGQGPLLYLQSLETGVTTSIAGTQRAMFPFWSPDSRSVGFFAAGKLLIVDPGGAPPRTIADAPDARGGAWAPDGTILFTPHTQAPIMRIPAAGGTPTEVTRLAPPHTTHRWPSIHPDGKYFVYLAAMHSMPESPETAIFMATLDGKETRRLVASSGNGFFWRDWLLYLKSNKLIAQRLENGALRGREVPVWDGVLHDVGTWRTVASASSTGLLAVHQQGGSRGTTLLWLDRSGKRLGEIGPPAPYREVAISPDGSMVALTIGDPLSAIYLHDLRRGSRTRFSFGPGGAYDVIWTPDGKHLVFTALDGNRFSIVTRPVDGSAPERTMIQFQSDTLMRAVSVTPDGRHLILEKWGPEGDIMRIPLAGGEPELLVGGDGQQYEGRLSPDGKWLAYISSDRAGRNLYLTAYPSGRGKWQISDDPAYNCWWNPKGNEIFYGGAYGIRAVSLEFEGDTIRSGTPQPLFAVDLNTNERGFSVSPDAERFLVVPLRQSTSGSATLVTNFDLVLRD